MQNITETQLDVKVDQPYLIMLWIKKKEKKDGVFFYQMWGTAV